MKAIVRTQYGSLDVLQFAEVATPTPTDDEVLISVCAAAVNPLDLFLVKGAPWSRALPGMRTPKHQVIGCDIAGRVEAVGKNVKQLQTGDEVFGVTSFGGNGFAEYACSLEEKLVPKPATLSFEEAAAVPIAAITALQGLRDKGGVGPGQKVLIEGASGGLGTFAIQIAKAFGAEVTAVCSPRNVATARQIGADHVIDYTQEDFAKSGERYDLILAANAHHSIFDYKRSLHTDGVYVAAGGSVGRILQALLLGPLLSLFGGKRMVFFVANINRSDLFVLKDLIEAGKVRPVIDRRYDLSEGAAALRYLAEGHAQGKIVLVVRQ